MTNRENQENESLKVQKAEGKSKIGWPDINGETLSSAALELSKMPKFEGLSAFANAATEWPKINDAALSSAVLELSKMPKFEGLSAFANAATEWPKVNAALSSAALEFGQLPKIDVKFQFSQSMSEMNEFPQERQHELEDWEETSFQDYSEEHIQFILNSLEEWLEGSISFKNTLKRIKGNDFAHWLMQTVVYGTILQLLFIFTIIGNQQLQQDRKVLETVQSYVESEVVIYKQYKKYFASSEEWSTSHSIGLSRKEVRLREGRTKTAPMVSDGVVGQKTIVLMFETKKNWRRVEVKINGTYVQGWVPESTIIRLENLLQN